MTIAQIHDFLERNGYHISDGVDTCSGTDRDKEFRVCEKLFEELKK